MFSFDNKPLWKIPKRPAWNIHMPFSECRDTGEHTLNKSELAPPVKNIRLRFNCDDMLDIWSMCMSVFQCSGYFVTKSDSFQHPPVAHGMGFGDHLVTHVVAPGAQSHWGLPGIYKPILKMGPQRRQVDRRMHDSYPWFVVHAGCNVPRFTSQKLLESNHHNAHKQSITGQTNEGRIGNCTPRLFWLCSSFVLLVAMWCPRKMLLMPCFPCLLAFGVAIGS